MRHSLQAFVLCAGVATALSFPPGSAFGGAPAPSVGTDFNSASASSWVAGAHAGYNWQNGSLVYGFETDLSGTGLRSSMNGMLVFPSERPSATSTHASFDWYGTVRGRLGVVNGPFLFYGTGGLAYGHVGLNSSVSLFDTSLNSSTSSTRAGWVGGVGMEYMYRPDLIFTLSYQYVDLGRLTQATLLEGDNPFLNQSATAHAQFQTVMAGFSWRFAPAAGTGPWQGGYAGGHAGGAWGLSTSGDYSGGFFPVSDIRLKRDVTLLGRRDDGLGIYRYKYLWSDTVYVGVMAQEVALIRPDAVVRDRLSGYMGVDYGRLGLRLMTMAE